MLEGAFHDFAWRSVVPTFCQTRLNSSVFPDHGDDSYAGRRDMPGESLHANVENHIRVTVSVAAAAYSNDLAICDTDVPPWTAIPASKAGWLTRRTRIAWRSILFKLLGVYLAISVAPLVAADPSLAVDRYRTPKLFLLGTSAVSSLGTGLASLQLDIPDDPHATRLAKMYLHIACSTFMGTLTVGYSLWFLPYAQRRQRFLAGLGGVGLFLWIFMRRDPPPATSEMGDAFAWLDDLNLIGLIAVVAGILNAESRLMASAFSHDDTDRVTVIGDEDANESGYRRPADEESQNGRHNDERDRRGDVKVRAIIRTLMAILGWLFWLVLRRLWRTPRCFATSTQAGRDRILMGEAIRHRIVTHRQLSAWTVSSRTPPSSLRTRCTIRFGIGLPWPESP